MKIAALFDIHGNLPALDAVLKETHKIGVDVYVIGGDALSGPMPAQTLERLRSLGKPSYFLHGNGESELLRFIATGKASGLTAKADAFAEVLASQLTEEQIAFLKSWQLTVTFELEHLGKVLFCHATPDSDVTIFTEETSDEELEGIFGRTTADLVICGHTHMQFERLFKGTHIMNAGSVGMPFGSHGAYWLLLDEKAEQKRTPYDYQLAASIIRDAKTPSAEDFVSHNLLSVPSKKDALAMMAALREKQVSHF